MGKKQKLCLISHILVWGGISISIFSIIFLLIYALALKNYEVKSIHKVFMALIFVGTAIPFFAPRYNPMYHFGYYTDPTIKLFTSRDGLVEGVPNNAYEEFNIATTSIVNSTIELREISKGIFECNIDNKKLKFDMRYWVRKRFYIYEYFMTKIQIDSTEEITKKNCLNKNELNTIKNLKLIIEIKNGKMKTYNLVSNHQTNPSFLFKYRIRKKWAVIKDIPQKSIETFYNYNYN